ncbi:MAG: glycosyltransferase family 2 protein [Bacteroidetes bacterium]|nr:glycosyltransferase family 2 protein [Bacteroidota bacterium]
MDFLIEAINSIQKYVECSYEIIIVDNASKDKTKDVIPALDANIKFIANTTNAGFSAANNQGFAICKGEYVLLLNPDAKLINSDITKAISELQKDPNQIIGPKILNPDLTLQDSIIKQPTVMGILMETFFLLYFYTPKVGNDFALSGACLLMKSQTYKNLGGLDENLFWMDDVDLCFRANQMNVKSVYFTGWTVVHDYGQSTKKNYNVAISNQLISKLKFFKKHKQSFNLVSSAILTQIQIWLRIVLFLVLASFKEVYRLKFFAYCYAQKKLFNYIFTKQNNLL